MQMLDPRPVASAGMGGIQRIFMVGIGGAGMSGNAGAQPACAVRRKASAHTGVELSRLTMLLRHVGHRKLRRTLR